MGKVGVMGFSDLKKKSKSGIDDLIKKMEDQTKTKDYKDVKIFLETSTGQGSEVCYKLEDLAYFYKKIS